LYLSKKPTWYESINIIVPWYLPNSICNLCEDIRSFVKILLSSKLLIMVRYFSRPKLFLHILYVFSLLSGVYPHIDYR
jgi:hypothetical protein